MRKVLIIANLSHASPRIPSLAKYLSEFNWSAIVLSGAPPEEPDQKFRIIQTHFPDAVVEWKKRLLLDPHKGFQKQIGIPFEIREKNWSFTSKLVNFIRGIIAYPDEHKDWQPFALKSADELFQKEKIDVIMSSSSPVTSHLIAYHLKRKWKIPWIADLRDLWTQNHSYRYGQIRKFFERKLELKMLKIADVLVTVTPPWAKELGTLHKRAFVYSITNGFDPELMGGKQVDLTTKFTITYTGSIYTGKQDPSKFLSALKDLIFEKIINVNDIEVRFYGPKSELLEREIKRYELSAFVKQYGIISREISFEKQKESQLLLIFYWSDWRIKGWYPLKLFEYLGAQRPILITGGSGNDVVEKLLHEAGAGIYCKTSEDVKDALKKAYFEYKNKGRVFYNGKIEQINQYSYREKAREFAKILDSLIKKD